MSKTELTLSLMGRQTSKVWNDAKMGRNNTQEAVRAQKRGNERRQSCQANLCEDLEGDLKSFNCGKGNRRKRMCRG